MSTNGKDAYEWTSIWYNYQFQNFTILAVFIEISEGKLTCIVFPGPRRSGRYPVMNLWRSNSDPPQEHP